MHERREVPSRGPTALLLSTGGALVLGLLLGAGILRAGEDDQVHPPPMPEAERRFLQRLAGTWVGEGTSEGTEVRDEMTLAWTLGDRFLRLEYRSPTDGYAGEGYVWFDTRQKRYEWWEFNNGYWPVRQHRGSREGSSLVLAEHVGERQTRLTLELVGDDTLEVKERLLRDGTWAPLATLTFRRKAAGSRPR